MKKVGGQIILNFDMHRPRTTPNDKHLGETTSISIGYYKNERLLRHQHAVRKLMSTEAARRSYRLASVALNVGLLFLASWRPNWLHAAEIDSSEGFIGFDQLITLIKPTFIPSCYCCYPVLVQRLGELQLYVSLAVTTIMLIQIE
jgi:hypothetical protein